MDASQRDRETRRLAEGREVILKEVLSAEKKGKVEGLPYQNYLLRQVVESVADDIKADIKGGEGAGAFKKFARYLGTIDPKLASLRAIQAVLGVLMREGGGDVPHPVWKKAAYAAGLAVYSEYLMQHFQSLSPALFNSLMREYSRSMTSDERHLLNAFKQKFTKEGFAFPTWDYGDIEHVGAYILTRLIAHRFVESWSRTEKKNGRVKTIRYLQLDEGLRGASLDILERVSEMPRVAGAMIEKPLDWDPETNQGGGFHTPEMQRQAAYAVQGKGPGRVAPRVVKLLNNLQAVEFQVNEPVLAAVRALALKRDFGDIISPDPGPKPEFHEGFSDEQKKEWKGVARAWYTDKKVRKVKHMRVQRVFQEAAELSQYPTIWFAYYADFRGRVYTRSANLSPQGNDLEKGLLRLKSGKPLDSASSVHWFKLHGANKFGKDKLTHGQRVAWVEENDEFIRRMGADPLTHTEWADAESPVQFLAWAVEYSAWRASPDDFVSHLAMSQDGTCNGLQNYSGLLADPVGGAAVNLVPADAPRDIYADVSHRVEELLQEEPDTEAALQWMFVPLDRSWSKRTTMTLPYGCTRFGCSVFINDELEKQKPPQIEPAQYGDAAKHLSYVMWDALDDIVVKAREAMQWLQGWAKHAAKTGRPVAWVSPSGLHVVSEYEGMRKAVVKSVAFKTRLVLYKPSGKPDMMKTANAVAPNFVHSLDAAHLERVVARAIDEGMTPVVIHDDFGVHAADTEQFHRIIREEFVAMYQDNTILQDMADSTGYDVPPPKPGDLDLRVVLDSPYFFS